MKNNAVFNMTICIIGILVLLVHITNLIIKRNKRADEKALLAFILFTVFHFVVYLTFTIIKEYYTSDPFIIIFYTLFYIFNNIQMLLLFIYMLRYVIISSKLKKIFLLINTIVFLIFVIMDIINAFTGIFFYAENGEYVRSRTMFISQGYQLIMFIMVFFVALLNKRLNIREKISFGIYCIIPLISIVLQNIFRGYAIAYASIIISVEILFFFVNVQKNMELAKEEEKNKDIQIKLMLSQIQPHFIYNSLSSISTLISIDPNKAQAALDDFTDYLRGNLSSISETKLIPFEDELKHIKTYLSLEKIRFNDRINVIYDVKCTDFYVPTLTIQPIVENAIKHGILKRIDGGTVIIRAYEDDISYHIEVSDDGVGFDIKEINLKEDHYGLNNIKYRINKTNNGNMEITSEKDKGTKVLVTFNK